MGTNHNKKLNILKLQKHNSFTQANITPSSESDSEGEGVGLSSEGDEQMD